MTDKQLITLTAAIAFALGGGSGTLAGDYTSSKKVEDLDERLRKVETLAEVTKTDVKYIKEKVDDAAETAKTNSGTLYEIKSLIQRGNGRHGGAD